MNIHESIYTYSLWGGPSPFFWTQWQQSTFLSVLPTRPLGDPLLSQMGKTKLFRLGLKTLHGQSPFWPLPNILAHLQACAYLCLQSEHTSTAPGFCDFSRAQLPWLCTLCWHSLSCSWKHTVQTLASHCLLPCESPPPGCAVPGDKRSYLTHLESPGPGRVPGVERTLRNLCPVGLEGAVGALPQRHLVVDLGSAARKRPWGEGQGLHRLQRSPGVWVGGAPLSVRSRFHFVQRHPTWAGPGGRSPTFPSPGLLSAETNPPHDRQLGAFSSGVRVYARTCVLYSCVSGHGLQIPVQILNTVPLL